MDHKNLKNEDYLIATYWQATIFNNAWINFIGSTYVVKEITDYLVKTDSDKV